MWSPWVIDYRPSVWGGFPTGLVSRRVWAPFLVGTGRVTRAYRGPLGSLIFVRGAVVGSPVVPHFAGSPLTIGVILESIRHMLKRVLGGSPRGHFVACSVSRLSGVGRRSVGHGLGFHGRDLGLFLICAWLGFWSSIRVLRSRWVDYKHGGSFP